MKSAFRLSLIGLLLAACQGSEPAPEPVDPGLTANDLVVGTAEDRAASASDGKVVEKGALPANYQEILDAWAAGGVLWQVRRSEALSDPDETRFLVDNLVLAMFEQVRFIQRAQGQLQSTAKAEAALDRVQAELVSCGPAAAEALAEIVAVGDDIFADMARDLLARMGAEGVPAVAALLERDKAVERYRALEALGRLPGARDLEDGVFAAMRGVAASDRSEIVRAAAVTALAERGMFSQAGLPSDQVSFVPWAEAIAQTLSDESETVRAKAFEALALLDEPIVVPAVIAAGRRAQGIERTSARKTLEALTGQTFGLDWDAWAAFWNRTEQD